MILRTALFNAILLTAFVGHCDAAPQQAAPQQAVPQQAAYKNAKPMQPNFLRQTVENQIVLFNNGNFQQAAQTGYEVLRREPGNSLARYYYAQTLFKLNRNADAKSQFAECYKITNDLKMKANCYEALKTLSAMPPEGVSPLSSSSSSSSSVANVSSPGNGLGVSRSSGTASSSTSSTAEVPTSDPAMISRKLQIMTEGSANIEHKRRQMLIEIGKAKERAAEHMNGIEQFFRRPITVNYQIIRWEQYENPEYSRELERSQRELKIKIEDLNAEFNHQEAEILADCKARAAVYDQVSSGLKSQQKIGTSQIQLTPQHSNGFVRHYVNYDGSDPVSLKARQGELTNTKPATTTKAKSATRTNKP